MKKPKKRLLRKTLRFDLNDEKEAKLVEILENLATGFQGKLLSVMAEEFIDTYGEFSEKKELRQLVDNYDYIKSMSKKRGAKVVVAQESIPISEEPIEEEDAELDSALGGFNY